MRCRNRANEFNKLQRWPRRNKIRDFVDNVIAIFFHRTIKKRVTISPSFKIVFDHSISLPSFHICYTRIYTVFNQKLSWKICRFFFQKGKRKKLFTLLSYVEQLPINYPFMIYYIRDSKKRMQYIKFFKLENKVLNEKIIHFFFYIYTE